ncbi:hypothetical protein [Alkalilimnicola sp. S0819]|uniref:hypothetical protein n=1 Tax=Alkalilimnicola sp. S0819 TaxID=2613922 RepID=UPI001261EAF6|nr:hypothetical protein [Alkalilimnicola sp. S0819]KAB7619491.1 hypothetical protein F3N43_13690 [Alkalilimnicola sp. S0819]MPQ17689.1 hypothetical protein [Alkalilimnicola sp. S0819]
MERRLIIEFEGVLAPGNQVSVRTLTKTLSPVQRAVDCIVYYERFGVVRKFSTLPRELYSTADFYLGAPEANCVIVPLLKDTGRQITRKLRTYLASPYAAAAAEVQAPTPLEGEIGNAINNLAHNNVEITTHEVLLEHREQREREYIEAKVVEQVNQAISPIRSSVIGKDDYISLQTFDEAGTTRFEFSRDRAKRFGQIVTKSRLGPVAWFEGTLHGLVENNSQAFPFVGEFRSNATKRKHKQKLLIPNESLALKLSPSNLRNVEIQFFAAPLTRYGAFDEVRGDIVLLQVVK